MLLDTSGLFCLLHRLESEHQAARAHFESTASRFTHSLVLAEFVALCQARRVPRAATLEFVQALLDHPEIDVVWVGEQLMHQALNLLMNRLDKSYSWCDAVSFVLMRERNVQTALSTDHHFDQEGFHRLLA